MSVFSTRLKELRTNRGISQQSLANNIGMSKSSINMYERGEREPGLDILEAISDYFNVDIDYLIGKSDIPNRALVMLSIGDRIKTERLRCHMTQEELALKIGTTKQAIYKYENNIVTNIPLDRLEEIAQALNVTAGFLTGWENPAEPENITDQYPNTFIPKMRKVPLLGKTACGEPIYSPSFDDGFALLNSDIAADFALEAQGESMSGIGIHTGDVVFFVAQDMVDNGQLAAVFVDNEVTLKRVYYYPDKNKLLLQSENPEFEPMLYNGTELNDIRIIGKAVAHLRRIK